MDSVLFIPEKREPSPTVRQAVPVFKGRDAGSDGKAAPIPKVLAIRTDMLSLEDKCVIGFAVNPDQIEPSLVVFDCPEAKIRNRNDREGALAVPGGADCGNQQEGHDRLSEHPHGFYFILIAAMPGDQAYITRKGYEKLHRDLEELKKKRPIIAKAIQDAREKGDLKENAEYHAAKEEAAHNERRIQELEGKLGGARILEDQGDLPTDKAYIGATVSVKDDSGEEMKFTLVDSAESDPSGGMISITSPIGQALLGQPVGAKVKVPVGKSGYTLHILHITRG